MDEQTLKEAVDEVTSVVVKEVPSTRIPKICAGVGFGLALIPILYKFVYKPLAKRRKDKKNGVIEGDFEEVDDED